MNPLDECLAVKEKLAASTSTLPPASGLMSGMGRAFGGMAGLGDAIGGKLNTVAGTAAVGGGLLGLGAAIRKIHGAMTKQRDFKQMMSLNPQLAEAQAARPEMFNQAYSSLRKLNPTFGSDPIVAGAYMHKMMVINPEQAGIILAEAAGAKGPQRMGVSGFKIGPLELK